MISDKSILAIIPARGGSKGVPRKNIRNVAGKPLIAWTIEEGKKSKYIDRIVLSSDDQEIIEIAKAWGCDVPFVRPVELAQDMTPGIEPVLHAMELIPEKYDYVVLLQPTSPLRTVKDIDGCIEFCIEQRANACVSVTEPDKSPYWMYTLDGANKMCPLLDRRNSFVRRQDLPLVFTLNGAVYMANSEWLLDSKTFITSETIGYPMKKHHSIDVDTELDLEFCQLILQNKYLERRN